MDDCLARAELFLRTRLDGLSDTFRYLPWWFWLSVFLIGMAIGYHVPDFIK